MARARQFKAQGCWTVETFQVDAVVENKVLGATSNHRGESTTTRRRRAREQDNGSVVLKRNKNRYFILF
jgi:hypothetical protein